MLYRMPVHTLQTFHVYAARERNAEDCSNSLKCYIMLKGKQVRSAVIVVIMSINCYLEKE